MDGTMDSMDMSLSKLQEIVKDREAWHVAVQGGHKESDMIERLNNNPGTLTTIWICKRPGANSPWSLPTEPALSTSDCNLVKWILNF